MKGKRYSKEEWEAAKSLKKLGLSWIQVAERIGRSGDRLGRVVRQFEGDYEAYIASYRHEKAPQRKTEQLQFLPPELPKQPKKIKVKAVPSEEEWTKYKLAVATRQAQIVKRFVEDLRDAGIGF